MSSKKNEKPLSTFLKKNKVLTFPLLALVPSILTVLIFIFVTALLYIIFLIPIIIFIAAHYTDTWGMKKRLKYAIPVFVLLLLIQTLILTPVSYENPGILKGKTPNDSHFSVYISPYSGVHSQYSVNATFYGLNTSHSYKPYFMAYSSGEFLNLTCKVSLQNVTTSDGVIAVNYTFNHLHDGDYYVEVILNYTHSNRGYNVTTGFVRGPIVYSENIFALSLLLNYTPLYALLIVIFIIFLLFSKSISNSKRKLTQRMTK